MLLEPLFVDSHFLEYYPATEFIQGEIILDVNVAIAVLPLRWNNHLKLHR